jgi:hypothetical protein
MCKAQSPQQALAERSDIQKDLSPIALAAAALDEAPLDRALR